MSTMCISYQLMLTESNINKIEKIIIGNPHTIRGLAIRNLLTTSKIHNKEDNRIEV